MRRFLASLLAALLVVAQVQQVAALTTGQRVVVLSGVQGWSFPGSSADLYFSLNAGSCAINRIAKPCSSLLTAVRASPELCAWSDNHYVSVNNNIPCITDLGIGVWQASTNQAIQARDMTQTAWVKVNVTAAKTATGIDNVANDASNLTAGAANGTALQTFTIGSTTETYSVFLERVSGTGNIQITENNGSTWTTADASICKTASGVASVLLTTSYVRCQVEATLANPVIGIRIVTNGDSVNVDFNQDEELAFATPPILTTTVAVARSADVISLTGVALTAGLKFPQWQYLSFNVAQTNGLNAYLLSTGDQTANNRISTFIVASGLTLGYRDVSGGSAANPTSSGSFSVNVKNAFARSISTGTNTDIASLNGATATTSSPAAYPVSPTTIGVGSNGGEAGSGAAQTNGFIRRLVIGNGALSATQIQSLAAMAY